MSYSTQIHISKSAIKNNINFLQRHFKNKVRISSVVKANAYGHGIEQFVPEVEKCGINHFSTFNFAEAKRVRKIVKDTTDIMILGWVAPDDLKEAIQDGYEFFVFEMGRLTNALKYAKELNIKAKLHLEVETGLNRTGFCHSEFLQAIEIIKANRDYFEVKGLCSHLAGPESIANHVRVKSQIKKLKTYKEEIISHGITPEYCHIACSAGAISYPEARFDLVRVGIMQYGFWSSKETFLRFMSSRTKKHDPLKRVICWKSQIMTIKEVKIGEFISYGTSYVAFEPKIIAIVPIGYSNGYSRSLSNNGRVLINGVPCSVVGLVNMNMIIVDVTHIFSAKVGDEVVIVGDQKNHTITVDSFSEISQQVNYEILSRIPREIPRVLVE
ncbi:alanine racemase [bacterium]|nr:alanine racemase [bacterium]